MDKKKTMELLEVLFDAARPDPLVTEWSDEAYILADLMRVVSDPPEVAIRELITEDAIDTIHTVYKVPRDVASRYFRETPEVMDNAMDRVYETVMTEIEDWISSTDILKYQNSEEI